MFQQHPDLVKKDEMIEYNSSILKLFFADIVVILRDYVAVKVKFYAKKLQKVNHTSLQNYKLITQMVQSSKLLNYNTIRLKLIKLI